MKVRKYYPARPSVVNQFWDDFFGYPMESSFENVMPSVNVKETDGSIEIELAAPGYARNDFNIEVEKRVLIITAKKEEETKDESTTYKRREFMATSFKRTFQLPDYVDAEQVQAKYDNGVLSVLLPKTEAVRPRVIEIS